IPPAGHRLGPLPPAPRGGIVAADGAEGPRAPRGVTASPDPARSEPTGPSWHRERGPRARDWRHTVIMAPKKKLTKAEAGRLGGDQTKRRHGIEHYREAGRKGFMATCARHWQGDKEGYLKWLRANGWLKEVRQLLDAAGRNDEILTIPG